MELYDNGASAEIIKKEIPFIKEDYGEETDLYHEMLVTAYALAFWEIGELTDEILNLSLIHISKLKTGFRNAGITWTERSRNPMSLSMASLQDLSLIHI